ncbi:MAG: response regulator [Alphaproteobacteria bacterium]|nr:response regulator [Alphaproteobacteria bacterium]
MAEDGILVVDDDPLVRKVIQRALERAGYRVVLADHGAAGLAALDADPHIRLLVSDVMMDDMIGSELVAAARARRPDLRFVYMSGETPENLPLVGIDATTQAFLAKPFKPMELLEKVKGVLG